MPNERPELSKKNPYYISRYRFYELKYFCLQYPEWKREYHQLQPAISRSYDCETVAQNGLERPVEDLAIRKAMLSEAISLVEQAAYQADPTIGKYLLKAVTEGHSFTKMKMVYGVPCEKDMWFDRYHRFFYILSQKQALRDKCMG